MWMSELIDSLWHITTTPSLGPGKLKRAIRIMGVEDANSQLEMLMKEGL
jgi:hypothetical protein